MEKSDQLLHSVKNALVILRLFSNDRPELGITEITSILGLNTSTVHRLVTTLTRKGFLEKSDKSRRYRLGLAFLGLGEIITTHMELHREAQPILESLVDQLGETVHIGVLEEDKVIYLHKVNCKHPVRLQSAIGKEHPVYCTATGRAILAYQSKNIIESVLQSELPSFTQNTMTDPVRLREYLAEVKKKGYAFSIDELHEDVVSIAVPVRDYTGEVIASISIAGPKERIPQSKFNYFISTLTLAGQNLSTNLGYVD
jgi:DNA-binding IclR family transcriptional regulator